MLSDVYMDPITKLHSAGGSHKHKKPFDWMAALIANTLRAGDIILDPFAGSGVTLDVANAIGAKWIGGDIDESVARKLAEIANREHNQYAHNNIEQIDLWK